MTLRRFILLFLTLPIACFGQKISEKKAKDDLLQLKEKIEFNTPRLQFDNPNFGYDTQAEIDQIRDSLSIIQFYQKVYRICTLSNNSEFYVGKPNDPIISALRNGQILLFPFNIRIIEGEIYIWDDISNEKHFSKGDVIQEINTRSSDDILKTIYNHSPSDSNFGNSIQRKLWTEFKWKYFLFVDQSNEFEVLVRSVNGQIKRHTVQGVLLQEELPVARFERTVPIASSETIDFLSDYFLTYEGSTATLRIAELELKQRMVYAFINHSTYNYIFRELDKKKAHNLIVDLRSTESQSMSYADDILPFIMKEKNKDSFLWMSFTAEGLKEKKLFPRKSSKCFEGTIYLIVDETTSATGQTLARYLVEYGNAISIGKETANRYEGWADIVHADRFVLPHSRTLIYSPYLYYQFPTSEKQPTSDRGLIPEYIIEYSLQDLLEGKDLEMEKALSLIRENNQK